MHTTDARPPRPTRSELLVAEFSGVTHAYGATLALDHLDLRVGPGEVVAVLGPNGAGKTTALHLLMGLLAPRAGSVRLFGSDPRERAARERLGVMLQVTGVPETLTVLEHLRAFAAYYPAPLALDEVIDTAGLAEVARRPYGKLSGGQRQRLHLGLALVGDPDLLVLDEPTSGLDASARRALWASVRAMLGRGRSVILTTHDLDEADALADRIVLLHHGRVLAEGTPGEIKANTASRRVRLVTTLDEAWLRGRPGVHAVRRDGQATEILCGSAERLVHELLDADTGARDLEVGGATLEDAFLALTTARPGAGAVAA